MMPPVALHAICISILFTIIHACALINDASVKCLPDDSPCGIPGAPFIWYNKIPASPLRTIRTRVHVLADDNGMNPVIPETMVDAQMVLLNSYYFPLRVQFQFLPYLIRNTTLLNKRALPFCPISLIGNGKCDSYCNVSITNYDGGDCVPPVSNNTVCTPGVCDEMCNIQQFDWDHGECCIPSLGTTQCKDPRSILRIYYDPEDVKALVYPLLTDSWNIYVIAYTDCDWCGAISVFPWNYNSTDFFNQGTLYNGILINNYSFGLQIGAHEFGHTLGLLHPFSGSETGTEEAFCKNPCYEGVQYALNVSGSDIVGDFLPDTRPTVIVVNRTYCGDPASNDCDNHPWIDTPFQNIMTFGYLTPNCVTAATAFTPMQLGRMRCYLEGLYTSWFVIDIDDDDPSLQ